MAATVLNTPFSALDQAWGPTNSNKAWTGAQGWLNADALGLGAGDPYANVINTGANAAKALLGANETYAGAKDAAPGLEGISAWLVRGTVIILGFIFVAIGLNMFKPNMVAVTAPP